MKLYGVNMSTRGMRREGKISDEQANEMYRLHEDGVSTKTIARAFKVSVTTVYIHLHKLSDFNVVRTNADFICSCKKIHAMYLQGYNYDQLARIWKMNERMVRRVVSEWYPRIAKEAL